MSRADDRGWGPGCGTPERMIAHTKLDENGCRIWQGAVDHRGYGRLTLHQRSWAAHRLAYTLLVGDIPDGLLVCHHCDVRRCCEPEHLFLGTAQDNSDDMAAKGRRNDAVGEAASGARLTAAQVVEVRAMSEAGAGYRELGRIYGIDHKSIRKIVLRKTWRHV